MKKGMIAITGIELEYDDEFNETEIKIIKEAVNNLQIAVKCIGDAIGKLEVRIRKIESRERRD